MSNEKPDEKKLKSEKTRYFLMAMVTVVLLALGIVIIWITKALVGTEGDVIYLGLILIPFFVFLALTGKLKQMSIFRASTTFVEERTKEIQLGIEERTKTIQKDVAEIGEYEPEWSIYLGKLKQ